MSEQQHTPPIKEFRAPGGVKAAIWRNKVERGDLITVQHSVKIQRRYKADTGWKTTEYFRPQDLPSLAFVAEEAFRFICLAEPDDTDGLDE